MRVFFSIFMGLRILSAGPIKSFSPIPRGSRHHCGEEEGWISSTSFMRERSRGAARRTSFVQISGHRPREKRGVGYLEQSSSHRRAFAGAYEGLRTTVAHMERRWRLELANRGAVNHRNCRGAWYFDGTGSEHSVGLRLEMESVDMTQESQDVAGRRKQSNFRWTPAMTSFMLQCLVEQANLGLKTDRGFKNTALNAVAKAVSAKFNLVVNETHVNNHLRHARKIWLMIKKIKDLSGVSWDDTEKKVVMGMDEFTTYIQSHPGEAIYINKPIENYEEMAIVCGNDKATGSFARTASQSSRSLGTRMEFPPAPPTVDHEADPQGLDDLDNLAQTQPPNVDIPTSSTSKTNQKRAKRMKGGGFEMLQKVSDGLDRLADAMKVDKTETLSTRLYAEVMTLSDYYDRDDLGVAFDHLISQSSLAYGFMAKEHSLRCSWMDRFLRQLRGDDGM